MSYIQQCEEYWIVKDDDKLCNAFVLKTSWSKRYLELIKKYRIKIIRLNAYTGWGDSDISFLSEIPDIQGVDILSKKVTDVSPIFKLKCLNALTLYCRARTAGDFTQLENLRSIGLDWSKVYDTIFYLNRLVSVNIIGYPEKDLSRWKQNDFLEKLRLESNRLESLGGINRFENIKQLELYRCRKIRSLGEIASQKSLERLELQKCHGISDLEPISGLAKLKDLVIIDGGDILSVAPLAQCRNLEFLQIAGKSTVLDGDFSSLLALPKLKEILIANRKHYSHSLAELEKKCDQEANNN